MTQHPSIASAANNPPVYSVGEISLALKRHVEGRFDAVRVKGEVSGCKRHSSGHIYFTLKDADACLDGVCWRNCAMLLAVRPEDGLEIIATGRLTTYPGRSKYQMIVEHVELAGEGALLKLLEERKRKLAAEGLFDPARKPVLPYLPDVIGVVTSPTGAVIRDILHRLADRFPRRVLLWPVAVQGPGAAEQVAAAISGFNRLPETGPVPRPDVLIVARGGGSLEDLWAFNEEIVVRAAAGSTIPLISAVGHETDTTLIDLASARRAPTPTAAAELAVPVRLELMARVESRGSSLTSAINRTLSWQRTRLTAAERGLPKPQRLIDDARQRLDDRGERLTNALSNWVDRRRQRLSAVAARLLSPRLRLSQARQQLTGEARALDAVIVRLTGDRRHRLQRAGDLLESYSYQRILDRGFALVFDRFGHLISSIGQLRTRMAVRLRVADGEAGATIDGGEARPRGSHPAAAGQESLF
ncbi:MAG: exodeoxyribonuclease VII large subunit [Rhodospirillales bacterium]